MALKFLNKKGWHTGSLRNIENVWKAEQKHEAEQRKLEELQKQIQEERERAEFRQLQEQAGLVPRQERLDFLYDSGLAVGKGSADGFKDLEAPPKTEAASSISKDSSVPGALFEDKPQSANDAWRKLHSDPLLLIRQREQEALARIKNNPMQMAMIRKSVEAEKKQEEEKRESKGHKKKHRKKSRHDKHSSRAQSDSEEHSLEKDEERRQRHQKVNRRRKSYRDSSIGVSDSERRESDEEKEKRYRHHESSSHKRSNHDSATISIKDRDRKRGRHPEDEDNRKSKHTKHFSESDSELKNKHGDDSRNGRHRRKSDHHHKHIREKHYSEDCNDSGRTVSVKEDRARGYLHTGDDDRHVHDNTILRPGISESSDGYHRSRRPGASKLTAEEKAAKLREMQADADLHEEQRWTRLKQASEADAQEAAKSAATSGGRNFIDSARKSVYGTEKGGSSTIEESVRRRSYYLQGRSDAEGNGFRR